jgi:hypothetical protein
VLEVASGGTVGVVTFADNGAAGSMLQIDRFECSSAAW